MRAAWLWQRVAHGTPEEPQRRIARRLKRAAPHGAPTTTGSVLVPPPSRLDPGVEEERDGWEGALRQFMTGEEEPPHIAANKRHSGYL